MKRHSLMARPRTGARARGDRLVAALPTAVGAKSRVQVVNEKVPIHLIDEEPLERIAQLVPAIHIQQPREHIGQQVGVR